jgi:hypothetical protein
MVCVRWFALLALQGCLWSFPAQTKGQASVPVRPGTGKRGALRARPALRPWALEEDVAGSSAPGPEPRPDEGPQPHRPGRCPGLPGFDQWYRRALEELAQLGRAASPCPSPAAPHWQEDAGRGLPGGPSHPAKGARNLIVEVQPISAEGTSGGTDWAYR